jgi:Golgi phosphoprotein 3 (GPP34)
VNNRSRSQIAIADDFYLMALDERTGKPRLHGHAMSLGLSGALLCELVLGDFIAVKGDRLVLLSPADAAVDIDPVHEKMLAHIVAEPHHALNVWLSFFAQTATEAVAERLVAAGSLTVETSRGLLRSKPIYVPVDLVDVTWRSLRIVQVISSREVETWADLALIGLLYATGLFESVIANATTDQQGNIRAIVAGLSEEPSLHSLICQVEALIAANVLGQRK